MDAIEPTQKDYFEKLYQKSEDPFRNWINDYEEFKRSIALGTLRKPKYGRVFEPGCGNGGMTKELARRSLSLLAADWSTDALVAARRYCSDDRVEFREMNFPREIPSEDELGFDLMVVSELLYYFGPQELEQFFQTIPKIVRRGGEILLIHWRGASADYPSCGDEVHSAFHKLTYIEVLETYLEPRFLISLGRFT